MYRKHILDHAKNPRFPGVLDPCDIEHEQLNPLCGDFLHMTLLLDENNHISEIAWNGEGCAVSQASASLLSAHVVGMSIDSILMLTEDDILSLLNIPLTPNRMKCAMLALNTLKNGIVSYLNNEGDG